MNDIILKNIIKNNKTLLVFNEEDKIVNVGLNVEKIKVEFIFDDKEIRTIIINDPHRFLSSLGLKYNNINALNKL